MSTFKRIATSGASLFHARALELGAIAADNRCAE
jgi:hypothetical protein